MPSNKEQILNELTEAETHIANAKQLVEESGPPDSKAVHVYPGDNLMQKIEDNPEGTIFDIDPYFVQDIGVAELPKPCVLYSGSRTGRVGEGARLIAILYVKHKTRLFGLTIDGANQNTILTGADHVTVDKCVLNGNPAGQHRGILCNATGMRVRNSFILNIARDIDTQAILGSNKCNDLEVIGCQLEASGENILFGGDTSESEEAMPRNILIKGNYISKRLEWKNDPNTCKCLLELKACDSIIVEDNVMEYSFVDGQVGWALNLSVRNEYGQSPWANVKNVMIKNNTIRHMAGGILILGRDDRGGAYPSQVMTNVTLLNNKFEDLSWQWGGNGKQVFITGGPDKLTIDGNYFDCPTLPNSALCFDQPQYLVTDLVVKNQKQFVEGEYGIFGTSAPGLGTPVLEMYAPGYIWENNQVLRSGSNINWPPGTIFL